MKQISVIAVLQAWVSDDANLEEIQEKVDEHLSYNEPDFRISEIKTQDENSDDELKEPWFRLKDSYVTESFTLSVG
jgi:hypothetical protein